MLFVRPRGWEVASVRSECSNGCRQRRGQDQPGTADKRLYHSRNQASPIDRSASWQLQGADQFQNWQRGADMRQDQGQAPVLLPFLLESGLRFLSRVLCHLQTLEETSASSRVWQDWRAVAQQVGRKYCGWARLSELKKETRAIEAVLKVFYRSDLKLQILSC